MEPQGKGFDAPGNGTYAVTLCKEMAVAPPVAAARQPHAPARRQRSVRGKRRSKQLLKPMQLARSLLIRLQAVPASALQEGSSSSCATLLKGTDAECKRMGHAGLRVRGMHIAFCPPTRDYEVTWAAGGNIRRAGAMSTAARYAARHIEGITCLAQDSAGNVLWGDKDGLLGRVPLNNAARQEAAYVTEDCCITALAVQPDGSCCWAGLESGELLVCRLNDSAASAAAGLVAQQQLLEPPAAAAAVGCASSSFGDARVSSILLCQGRAFVAAGDSAATATLQMWQGTGSSSSSSSSNGVGCESGGVGGHGNAAGGAAPHLLDSVCIGECEWLGRSPVTAMTLLYPSSIQQARSISGNNFDNTAAAAAPAAAAAGSFSIPPHAVQAAQLPELQQAQSVLPYLVTGHANGLVVIWVTDSGSSSSSGDAKLSGGAAADGVCVGGGSSSSGADWLTPLLCIMPSSQVGPSVQGLLRGVGLAVKGLAVVEGTGLLCCGHSSGKVALHLMSPMAFQRAGAAWGLQQHSSSSSSCGSSSRPRRVPEPEQWWPDTVILQDAHVTGMDHLLAAPVVVNEGSPVLLLFSAGKSGSVKRWKLRLSHLMHKLGVVADFYPCISREVAGGSQTLAQQLVQAPSGAAAAFGFDSFSGWPTAGQQQQQQQMQRAGSQLQPGTPVQGQAAATAAPGTFGWLPLLQQQQQQMPSEWSSAPPQGMVVPGMHMQPSLPAPTGWLRAPQQQEQQQQAAGQSPAGVLQQQRSSDTGQQQQPQQQQQQHPRQASGGGFSFDEQISMYLQQQKQQQQQQQPNQPPEQDVAPQQQHTDQQQCSPRQQQQQQQQHRHQFVPSARSFLRRNTTIWARDIVDSRCNVDLAMLDVDPDWGPKERYLGEGSFGCVERRLLKGTVVAVKFLNGASKQPDGSKTASWDRAQLSELRHEVEVLQAQRHPNVVLFMGLCVRPPAVITEFCESGSLNKVLEQARYSPALALRIRPLALALDAAQGMAHLHGLGFLHRDLKSANLFCKGTADSGLTVKVGDLGLSHRLKQGQIVTSKQLEINPSWCAPEALSFDTRVHYGTYSDVYSFGICLWELLAWRLPWEAPYAYCGDTFCRHPHYHQMHITNAVRAGMRPKLPSNPKEFAKLPGVRSLGAAVQGYVALMMRCWAQDHSTRPTFDEVVKELKVLRKAAEAPSHSSVEAAVAAAAAAAAATAAGQQEPTGNAAAAKQQQQHGERAELPPAAAAAAGPSFMHGLAPLPECVTMSSTSPSSPDAAAEAAAAAAAVVRPVQCTTAYASLEADPASSPAATPAAAAAGADAVQREAASSWSQSPFLAHEGDAAAAADAGTQPPTHLPGVHSSVDESPFEVGFAAGSAAVDSPAPALPGAKLPKASSTAISPFEVSGALLLADLLLEGPGSGALAGAAT